MPDQRPGQGKLSDGGFLPKAATVLSVTDADFLRQALRLARRGLGATSPNPTVGAVLVKGGKIIGCGRTAPAGGPHAEIQALRSAQKRGHNPKGSTLYVTLEPCCTHGRTPPCTDAIKSAGIRRVVVGATDPNPQHAGRGFKILKRAGIEVVHGLLWEECAKLNEPFNHWIVHRMPFVTVKAAMTLDGKIATASGESKWITGDKSRAYAMKLRAGSDAIMVGINTILADDPSLTVRRTQGPKSKIKNPRLRRIILDSRARTPLTAKIVRDEFATLTTIVVSNRAQKKRVALLEKKVRVLTAPATGAGLNLSWLLKKLGAENVTRLLVEGGGEVNASFLLGGFAQSVAFFYAPKILGGRDSRTGVAGQGAKSLSEALRLGEIKRRKLGDDLLLTARVLER